VRSVFIIGYDSVGGCRLKRRIWRSVLALLPALALGAVSPAAGDESVAVVGVGNCSVPGTASLPRAFRNALKNLGTASVMTEAETVAPLGGASLRSMAELKQALADGRDDFLNGLVTRALQALQSVTDDVARLPPSAERWDLERSALTSLAQVQGRTDRPAARATLRRVLAVDPDYIPDPSIFPPSFLAEVTETRIALKQAPTFELQVVTVPVETGVVVGGRPMGPAPLTLHLPPGTYGLEGMWGYRGMPETVQLGGPPQGAVTVELSKAIEGSIVPDAGPCVFPVPNRLAALERFAALVKVKRVYAVRLEASGTEQTVVAEEFDVASGVDLREKREPVVAQGPVTDAAARLAATLTAPTPPKDTSAAPTSSTNTGLRTWSYILGAVGITATTIGVIFFINGNSKINDLNTLYAQGTPANSFPAGYETTFQTQNSSGKSSKSIGTIVGSVGVAALATGVTLVFVSAGGSNSSGVAVNPYLQPGGGGAVIAGRF
jgi:hypothetical protein